MSKSLAVVIVTFNRCEDLKKTLEKYVLMEKSFRHIVIVNNASTDGTAQLLKDMEGRFFGKLLVRTMLSNLGGAGGFCEGAKVASELDADWVWMSDDDAIPELDCLDNILKAAVDENVAYGSVSLVKGSVNDELCWPVVVKSGDDKSDVECFFLRELRPIESVGMLTFLGFMVSRRKIMEVGFPNEAYFISGDDAEYSIRLLASGAKLQVVRDSVLRHPEIPRYIVRIGNNIFQCLRMPPWRRRLDVRNRLWNARLAFGSKGLVFTVASVVVKFIFSLYYDEDRWGQFKAHTVGVYEGLFQYSRSGNKAGLLKK